jgi:hypothetical protein
MGRLHGKGTQRTRLIGNAMKRLKRERENGIEEFRLVENKQKRTIEKKELKNANEYKGWTLAIK